MKTNFYTPAQRRSFLKMLTGAAGAVVGLTYKGIAFAKELVKEGSLHNYVHDASKAERKPKMGFAGEKQLCSNCIFYQTAQADGGKAPCSIFANKLVMGKGWCSQWVPGKTAKK